MLSSPLEAIVTAIAICVATVIGIALVSLCFLIIIMSKTLAVTTAEAHGLTCVVAVCSFIFVLFWSRSEVRLGIIIGAMDV